MLISATLSFLACQGCVGTAVHPEYAALPAGSDPTHIVVSEGIRMTTSGVFTNQGLTSQPSHSAPQTGAAHAAPAPVGPVISSRVNYSANEIIGLPWENAYTVTDTSDQLSNSAWSSSDGVQSFIGSRDAARIMLPAAQEKNFSAEFALGATRQQTGLAFDVNVVPSISYIEEGEFETRRVGAELRLGRQFDQRGTSNVADAWYVFAGTEGEALVWEAGEYGFSNVTGSMALRDQVTVGDLQAGVSFQRGDGQLSLSYIRREVSWSDRTGSAEKNEDFAGISFTLRR